MTSPHREGKIKLELHYPGDGRAFLNFWNWYNGKDVVAQIVDGKLVVLTADDVVNEMSFAEFIAHVEKEWDAIPNNLPF